MHWSEAQMVEALYCRFKSNSGQSFAQLAKENSIPATTLRDWTHRLMKSEEFGDIKRHLSKVRLSAWFKSESERSTSHKLALSTEQEFELVSLIRQRALEGKPMRKIAIREEAARIRDGRSELEQQRLLDEIFSSSVDSAIPTMSHHWMDDFLGRWKNELTTRAPSSLTKARAKGLNQAAVSNFFDRIGNFISIHRLGAESIANFDEKGFEGEGEDSSRVVVPAHFKHSDVIRGAYRDHWSVGVCVFANGFAVPPAVAFKGKRFPPELLAKLPLHSIACVQENGYFYTIYIPRYPPTHQFSSS